MNKLDFFIKSGYGKYSVLDKEYNNLILSVLSSGEEREIKRWEVYNIIMGELLHIDEYASFEEVKYRITDGDDPIEVFMSIVNKHKKISTILCGLSNTILDYKYKDKFMTF